MFRICGWLGIALAVFVSAAASADEIPPELIGVWATDGAVFKGQLLFEGQAIYLGADGIGAIVGGPPPVGLKIIATFNAQKSTVEFDTYDGQQRGPHGSFIFDQKSKTIDSGAPKHDQLRRIFEIFTNETKHALGLI